jgi:cytochrome c biogenesis protein CcmG/thiol:disulfide interchange protein DsbE
MDIFDRPLYNKHSMINPKRWWLFTILILSLSAAWIWFNAPTQAELRSSQASAPAVGFIAPDLELTSLAGDQIQLSQFHGQAILLNFWASWCPPCKSEMPAMQQAYEEYADHGFSILAVNATNVDTKAAAYQFAQDNQLTFPILFDPDGEVAQIYRASSLPTSFFIDRDGNIQDVVIGGPMSEALLRTRIEKILGEQ